LFVIRRSLLRRARSRSVRLRDERQARIRRRPVAAELGITGIVGRRHGSAADTDIGTAAGTCNSSKGTPASSYWSQANPATAGGTGTRYSASDTRGNDLPGYRCGREPDSRR
jgi:hypothetical protein